MDWAIGVIIVSICLAIIYGAVYGWLFFGAMCMITGVVESVVGK
jgi:hypothetical protein